MSSAAWSYTQGPTRTADGLATKFDALCGGRDVESLAVGAGLCAVPISIAASEAFLALALMARLAAFARNRAAFRPPRVFWFWLVWSLVETAAWLQSSDRRAGGGEMRHLLLSAALFTLLPALNRVGDKLRVWKGIFATATLGSIALILTFLVRMARYRHELAAGGDPALYLRTGGLLHNWMIYGTVEILVFAAMLEFRAVYPEESGWTKPVLAVHAMAILLSLTRSLWFAAFLALGVHLVWWRSKWKWALPLVPAAIFLLSPSPVRHRLAETFQPDYSSNSERVQMWRVGLHIIHEQPIFGIGPGRIEPMYARFLQPGEPIPAYHGHLHNNALQLCAQFGVFVLCAAVIFVAVLVRDLAHACKRAIDRESVFLRRSGLQGVIGFLVMGMMDYTYGHSLVLILLAFTAISPLIKLSPISDQLHPHGRPFVAGPADS
jgi:O-antigen ligase